MFNFDFLGMLIGKAARRKLEAEVTKGGGPVLAAILPIVRPVVQAETAALEQQAAEAAASKLPGGLGAILTAGGANLTEGE